MSIIDKYNKDLTSTTEKIVASLAEEGVTANAVNHGDKHHIEIPLSQWNVDGYATIDQLELETLVSETVREDIKTE